MNQCDNYSMAVQLYLDNELMGSTEEFFLRHASECAHCREQLELEQRLSALLRRTLPLYVASEELRARVEGTIPLGRVAVPTDIADAVALLASGRLSYMTGAPLIVDGGMTAW